MSDTLRNAGIILLIFLVSVLIYLIGSRVQSGELNPQLQQLGDKFLGLVPDGENKDALQDYYAEFAEKVNNREVAPEEVERVAAAILNASNSREKLTPEQAREFLKISERPAVVASIAEAPKVPPRPDWDKLNQRLKMVVEFNELLAEKQPDLVVSNKEVPEVLPFTVGDGLEITLDSSFHKEIQKLEFDKLAIELKALEKENMVRLEADWGKKMKSSDPLVKFGIKFPLEDKDKAVVDSILRDVQKELKASGVDVDLQ